MTPSTLIEIYGYIGSALVVISMLMSSVVKLRVINTIGSVISGTYALIIGSFPLALMNICLIAINLYNLKKLTVNEQHYTLVDTKAEEACVNYFITHFEEDIKNWFPDFTGKNTEADVAQMIFCEADPAGVLLGKNKGNGEIEIILEYTSPKYRDCSVGKFLYDELEKRDVKSLMFTGNSEKHKPYLEKMGYVKTGEGYVKHFS